MELVIRETDEWFLTRSERLSKDVEGNRVSREGHSNELDIVRHDDGSLVLLNLGTVNVVIGANVILGLVGRRILS